MRAVAHRRQIIAALNRSVGAVLALGVLAGIVWASNAPVPVHRSDDGILRLAWSVRPERIEKCRQRTAEELAQLPQHMRQAMSCEGTTAEYQLQLRVDGVLVAERLVRGGGLRRDRRLYVFEELPLRASQDIAIQVRLDRVEPADAGADPAQLPLGRMDRATSSLVADSVPPHLLFEQRLRVWPREVVLVTYDRDRRELRLVRREMPRPDP